MAVFLVRAQIAVEGRNANELIPLCFDEEMGTIHLPCKLPGYRRLFAMFLGHIGYTHTGFRDRAPDLDWPMDLMGGCP